MDDIDLRNNYYGSIARKFLHLAPTWMDIEDLMQEARIAHLQGRKCAYGILDGLRKSRRMARNKKNSKLNRYLGWEVSIESLSKREQQISNQCDTIQSQRSYLMELAHELPENQKLVILAIMEGWSQYEISSFLSTSTASIHFLKNKAIRTLRNIWMS